MPYNGFEKYFIRETESRLASGYQSTEKMPRRSFPKAPFSADAYHPNCPFIGQAKAGLLTRPRRNAFPTPQDQWQKSVAENKYTGELGELVDNINDMSMKIGQNEKMKTEFISSVSHELRTPLTAISGWGETLLADRERDQIQLHRGLRIILNESRRLSTMVEELLEFSKMEDGRFTLQLEEMDLQAEFEDAIFTYRELFRQEGIELRYEPGEEILPPISGDPERLKQVFCNVLDNAAKHGGAGRRIDASLTREGTVQVVRVRDYGPGVPAAELPYVKQKFYKGSSKARGSGIGLAVCDEIVRLHGGTFDIANAEGGGAVVTICIPEKE